MSRSLALSGGLAVGSFLMLATALVLVRHEPSAPAASASARDNSAARSDARETELAAALKQRESELDELRAEVGRLQMLLDQPRQPAETVAAAASAESLPQPRVASSGLDAAVSFLRAAFPERFGKLTPEEAAALTELDLRDAQVTDDDLAHLAALPALQKLCLSGTAITDAGLAHMRDMPQLNALDLRGTQVTGAGIAQLPSAQLTALHLTDTRVTGQDLHWLPSMPNLLTLKLNHLAVGDDAVADLRLFPSVQHLEIDGTAITDLGLCTLLAQNSALQRVELRYCAVTPQGLAQLQQAYPNVQLVSAESSGGPVLR